MPVDWNKYPANWESIRHDILERAEHCCEFCGVANHGETQSGKRVVLTIAHLDHDTTHNEPENLRALCQKCHLTYDAKQHATNAALTRRKKKERAGQLSLNLR